MNIHPKVSAAALGSALGLLLVGILQSISGIHLVPEAYASIPAFLSVLGGYLAPSPDALVPAPVAVPLPPLDTTKVDMGKDPTTP